MRSKQLAAIWLPLLVLMLLWPVSIGHAETEEDNLVRFRGVILTVDEAAEGSPLEEAGYESKAFFADVRIISGPHKDRLLNVYHLTSGNPAYDILIKPGDKVMLEATVVDGDLLDVYITSYVRDTYIYWAVGAFVLVMLLLGGKSGMKSLLGLGLTGTLIFRLYLPLLLQGKNPVLLAIATSAIAVVLCMVLVGGFSRKTLSAILGTVGGVIVAGILAVIVGRISNLTGLSEHETQMLLYIPQNIPFDYQGLLFGGMVIGALGAVMDVGMSIASALFEIQQLRPDLGPWQLFRSGMNVGRDTMGTMTNTLVLAHVGGSTSMLLLFLAYQMPLDQIMNLELVAAELVRSVSGSLGLISAIPLTAAAAAWLCRLSRDKCVPQSADSAFLSD